MKRYQLFFYLFAACAPSLAMGQSVTADVARNGAGNPMLDANGDWVWEVTYNNGVDNAAAAFELGTEFGDSEVISGSVIVTGFGNGDIETANPGSVIFGWEILNGDGNPEGLQVDSSQGTHGQAYYAFGSGIISASSSLLLVSFTTVGPSHFSSRTSSIDVNGIAGLASGTIPLSVSASIEALAGDVNLDGMVDADDLAVVDGNLGQMLTGGWAVGDLDRSGAVDATDRRIVRGRIPEPASICLAMLAVLACGVRRR